MHNRAEKQRRTAPRRLDRLLIACASGDRRSSYGSGLAADYASGILLRAVRTKKLIRSFNSSELSREP